MNVLIALLILCSAPLRALEPVEPEYRNSTEAQRELDKLMLGKGSKWWMFDGRPLSTYLNLAGKPLLAELRRLDHNSVWLDSGANEPVAQLHYLARLQPLTFVERLGLKGNRANAVALSLQEPPGVTALSYLRLHYPAKFRFVQGNIKDATVQKRIGPVDLITDIQGPLAYDLELDKVWQAYHAITRPGSRIVLVLMSERLKLFDEKGKRVLLLDFFKSLPGFKVLSSSTAEDVSPSLFTGDPRYRGEVLTLVLQRTKTPWKPIKIRFKSMRMNAPPTREFIVNG